MTEVDTVTDTNILRIFRASVWCTALPSLRFLVLLTLGPCGCSSGQVPMNIARQLESGEETTVGVTTIVDQRPHRIVFEHAPPWSWILSLVVLIIASFVGIWQLLLKQKRTHAVLLGICVIVPCLVATVFLWNSETVIMDLDHKQIVTEEGLVVPFDSISECEVFKSSHQDGSDFEIRLHNDLSTPIVVVYVDDAFSPPIVEEELHEFCRFLSGIVRMEE